MKFSKGDIVQVRLAGLLVTGTVKGTKLNGDYVIQFESGNEQEVTARNIKLYDSGKGSRIETLAPKQERQERTERRSPSRLKSPTRRSPGRPASPSRRTRASPSPSRKKSSTVVTSPATGAAAPAAQTAVKSPNIPMRRILKVSLENIESKMGDSIASSVMRRKRLRDPDSTTHSSLSSTKDSLDSDLISNRVDLPPSKIPEYKPEAAAAKVALNRNLFMKSEQSLASKVNDIGKFSDDDETPLIGRKIETAQKTATIPEETKEFAGWFGALLLTLLIPGAAIALNIFCNKDSCTYRRLPNFREYRNIKTYFDLNSFGFYAAYVTCIAILSRIPFVGRKIKSQPSKENMYTYQMNGLFSAFTVLAIIIGLEIYQHSVVNYVFDHYFQLMISGILFGAVLSVLLFVKSKFVAISQLNPNAVTYNFLYDFFMGRQINPRVLNFDIKTILLRSSNIAILLINSIFIYKSMNIIVIDPNDLFTLDNYRFDLEPALLLASILQIIYVLDMLTFESNLTTTFELQSEGLGYMKVMQYAVYPFLLTSITKYLYEHGSDADDNPWILTAICLVFLAGYILYRGSNSQKNAFRLNPYDSAFQQMATLQTTKGKKILMSGFWGKLRHPNYTGDILIHFALGACAAGSPAALSTLPISLMLAYRAARDNNRCKQRYTSAWERYTHKVKYAIIPKIF